MARAASLYEPELLIVSTGLLSRPERLRGLPEFDGIAYLYDRGPIDERPLQFTCHDDPVFDALLARLTASPMPVCTRRLEVQPTEPAVTCIGYAVNVRRADGRIEPELVDTLDQVRELALAEDHPVDDAHLLALEAVLQRKAATLHKTRRAPCRESNSSMPGWRAIS